MNLTFVYMPGFVREWNRLRLADDDLRALEQLIARAPDAPPVIRGASGLRKVRFAPPSRQVGKSGAMRVGFAYFRARSAIIVVSIFSKSDAPNFTAAQLAGIAATLRDIERTFK